MRERGEIAGSAAARLETATELPPAIVGFDGFIDEITDAVDVRRDMTPGGYLRLGSIPSFAARIGSAAGKSTNIELVVRESRFGGNGPLMAGALANLGLPVTYIGAVGDESDRARLHPLFREFARRCQEVIPVEPPSLTHALEFGDGKIMFNKPATVQAVTWERLVEAIGENGLAAIIGSARLLGIVNWALMGGVEGIWRGLIERVFPTLAQRPRVFIDLSDPAKRTDDDLRRALSLLAQMNRLTPVTLGLNLAEAERLARVCRLDVFDRAGAGTLGEAVQRAAGALRDALSLACIVIHPREGAGAAAGGPGGVETGWLDGPFTRAPALSTGAGDHFNAGFAGAQTMGMPVEECLAVGCAVSGAYVRDARSPSRLRTVAFLRELPRPEAEPG